MSEARLLIITTVPEPQLSAVVQAMGDAGAGVIGTYTHCAFYHPGTGQFLPGEAANPAIGERGLLETVAEMRVEMVCDRGKVRPVLAALRAAHPYEEPAIYLLPLLDEEEVVGGRS